MKAPSLLTRALVTSFVTVAIVLGAVFAVLSLRVRDLSPHIPIVELHHERPDGLGYPYGLRGDGIPLAARIVHVADAFDAMTSARAYRSGRLPVEAVAELRRCIGSDFDGPAVLALVAALPRLVSVVDPVSGSSMEEHWSVPEEPPEAAGRQKWIARAMALRRCDRAGGVSLSASARVIGMAAALTLSAPVLAFAQTSRFALDAVAAAAVGHGSQVTRHSTAWFDVFGAVRIADGLDLRARPVVFRRAFDGSWQGQIYELAMRYERPGPIGLRVDAGQFSNPIGLSILENRPDKNPVVSQHSTLYLPVPRYEVGTPSTNLLAAAYPLGAKVTVSGAKWDARAAVIDSSPIRGRPFFGDDKPPRMANFVAGAGVTPYIGLRFGVAVGTGAYADESEVRDQTRGDRHATLTQVEAEWAFRYTRIAGEFLWTTRQLAASEARVDGGWIELTQTLTPRVFAAARYDDQWTEWTSAPDQADRHEPYRRFEATAGFRLTPELTVRASYMTRKGYVVGFWDDQVLASIVFAKRIK